MYIAHLTGAGAARPRWGAIGAAAILVSMIVLAAGCERKVTSFGGGKTTSPAAEQAVTGNFELAMGFLFRLDEFEPHQARQQILYYLNQWISRQAPHPDWTADYHMLSQLPSRFPERDSPDILQQMQFQLFDVYMLQEAVWMRDLARWVTGRPAVDARIGPWLAELAEARGADHAERVGQAFKLFDWVVRNIQLDPADPGMAVQDALAAGIDPHPPGVHYGWETLLLGHGDYLERSRVFVLMARQLDLPVVMLGIQQDEASGDLRPWAAAAVVGDQLYLFDPRLGLPIPGPQGRGIATFEELRADPQLLEALHLPDKRYPVQARDLSRIVALIDATPPYLSQRMKIIESALSGERKVVLSVAAGPLRRSIQDTFKGLAGVRLWTQPYEAIQYHRDLPNKPEEMAHMRQETAPFDRHSPLSQARIMHFQGQFDAHEGEAGAKQHYLMAHVSDAEIEQLAVPDEVIEMLQDPLAQDRMLENMKQLARRTKQAASYWLGLVHYDTGNYQVAIDFFQKRTLDHSPDGPWSRGARYNLARCYEALALQTGDAQMLATAREHLVEPDDQAPQTDGNRLRAQWLEHVKLASNGDGSL